MIRDIMLALRARRAGAKSSLRIIREARQASVPLSWAFALCEQESSFRNVFGHDDGSLKSLKGHRVTRRRVRELLAYVAHGGMSNGVGFTQLTFPPLIRQAEALGGAHLIKNQVRVGLAYLHNAAGGDYAHKAWLYNGAPSYQAKIAAKQQRWHRILTGKGTP